jgi:ABC-2 type transport system ATP-binding protein
MQATADVAIEVRDLHVDRGTRTVLHGVDLEVRRGEVFALLGGNGAGKSTLLHALLGFLPRRAGTLGICGLDPAAHADAVRARIAYVPETVALYEHLDAYENIAYFLDIAGSDHTDPDRNGPDPNGKRRSRADVDTMLDDVGLDASVRTAHVGTHSKGMRQKVAIALALLRRTPVLLLDEPTSGLDPVATADFHRLLATVRTRGVAVLMVTHDLLGAVDVADQVGVLVNGRIALRSVAADDSERFDLRALQRALAGAQSAAAVPST